MKDDNRMNEKEIKRLEKYADKIIGLKRGELTDIEIKEKERFEKSIKKNKSLNKLLKKYMDLTAKIKDIEKANQLEFETYGTCPEKAEFKLKYNWEGKTEKKHSKTINKLETIKEKLEEWTAKNNRKKALEVIEELEKKAKLKSEGN